MKAVATFLSLIGLATATISATDEGLASGFLNILLRPNAKGVQYVEVDLQAPGYIDLTELKFSTIDDGHDPDGVWEAEDDDTINWDDEWSEYEQEKIETFVDVALVYLPDSCPMVTDHESQFQSQHCDFTEVGVGRKYSPYSGTPVYSSSYWCCTAEEVDLGICDGSVASYGRMMMNLTTFEGSHRYIKVPPYGKVSQEIEYGRFKELAHSGKYAVVFSNCHETAGREIVIQGDLKVQSSGPPPKFDVAMKSFVQHSIEQTKEMKREERREMSLHVSNMAIAWIFLGVLAIGLYAQNKLGRFGVRPGGGYHSFELSESQAGQFENGYVPISGNW